MLEKVSAELTSLVLDPIFRHQLLQRNAHSLQQLITSPNRPTRKALVRQNVMRGVTKRQVTEGEYATASRYETAEVLDRRIKISTVSKSLRNRPTFSRLVKRNLVPLEQPRKLSPKLWNNASALKRQMRRDNLRRNLRQRESLEAVRMKMSEFVYLAEPNTFSLHDTS